MSLKYHMRLMIKNTHDEDIRFIPLKEYSNIETKIITGTYSNKPIAFILVVPDYDSSRKCYSNAIYITSLYIISRDDFKSLCCK